MIDASMENRSQRIGAYFLQDYFFYIHYTRSLLIGSSVQMIFWQIYLFSQVSYPMFGGAKTTNLSLM